jgi:predicted nucleic acid-binding protein
MLVDTSVWIEYLNGQSLPEALLLDARLDQGERVFLTLTILQEILQGARTDAQFEKWSVKFSALPLLLPLNPLLTARGAADLYRRCRAAGVTPRSSMDCLIAQLAIEHQQPLLHRDKDSVAISRIDPRLNLIMP